MFRSFIHLFGRYKTATLLNLAGLTVAFAAFMLLMMQVRYELGYDRQYAAADRIYRIEVKFVKNSRGDLWSIWLNRMTGETLVRSCAGIDAGGAWGWFPTGCYDPNKGRSSAMGLPRGGRVSPALLDLFEFEIVAGDTSRFREPNTVMISESHALAMFGRVDPIGRMLALEGNDEAAGPQRIVAVYRDFPKNSTVRNGIFADIRDYLQNEPGNSSTNYYVRLGRTADKTEVESDMTRVVREISGDSLATARLTNLHDVYYVSDCYQDDNAAKGRLTTTYSLLSVALLIVLVAAVNFVNFSVALVPLRIRGINTRKIFGCRASVLRRGMLTDAVLLSLIAFLLSLAIVFALRTTSFAGLLSGGISFAPYPFLLPLSLGVALMTGLLAGLYPAFYSTSFNTAMVVKGSFGSSVSGRRLRLGLISVQFVISITLIVAALFVRGQNEYMRRFDVGFDRENIVSAALPVQAAKKGDVLAGQLLKHSDIADVTFAAGLIVGNQQMGWGRVYKEQMIQFHCYPVAGNFLSFFGIDVVEGRGFRKSDELKTEGGTIVFNRTAQRMYDITVGDRLSSYYEEQADIVGIVKDFNFKTLQYPVGPLALYLSHVYPTGRMFVKFRGEIGPVMEYIRLAVRELDPGALPLKIEFLDEAIGDLYQKENDLSALLTLFSLLAVLISVVGVFGLVLFETQYRRREIGLRKVHGATVGEILRMFNRTYVLIVLACFVAAAPLGWYAVSRWLDGFAYKAPVVWWIFAVALLLVLAVTVLTITLQSYRTARENPVRSIKTE